MFNFFNKKQKQALEQSQKEYNERIQKVLDCLHPNTRELLVKDVETYKTLMKNREIYTTLMLLILTSKVDWILDWIESSDADLASTVEVHKDDN
jgi:hypothetical protein